MQSPNASLQKKIRLGDTLVENRIISEAQLQEALKTQKKTGHKLGSTLIELGFIEEDELLQFLSQQLQIPKINLARHPVDQDTVQKLPEGLARRFRAVVLEYSEHHALVGMADPTNLFAYDEISRVLKRRIRQAVVCESELLDLLDRAYQAHEGITSLAEELDEQLSDRDVNLEAMLQTAEASETPVFKLLHHLFEDALQRRASDIHIEPDETVLRIRNRIDGLLHERIMNEKRIAPALIQRLKILSELDISEKRLPQDGRFHIKLGRHSLDIRISTMPTQHGEAVVMRLLDQTHGAPKLSDLNMPEAIRTQWERLIHHQHGMLLVTGPTGSGKTTTLYASLDELNHPENKIITIEDPVEYRLPRVNQVQVHEKIGLTFSQVLRTSLRQDPDILLVGEMRDLDTVEVGLRASMTGHLVFSTLHTNSAIGTISRLLDMGANGYLLASSLLGIVAQRLVKKVCSSCAEPYQPDVQQAAWLQGRNINESILFNRGKGCPQCSKTGYQGRVGIYEILQITPAMTDALRKNDLQEFNEAVQANEQYQTLSDQVMDYAIRGITSLDEVIRLSSDSGH
ncbi:MAG: GspE/PulE family protein [Gammaproteobacteria bacterium]|nr:GspE/PulE family protein [Gammaproteobacteria bacterium]